MLKLFFKKYNLSLWGGFTWIVTGFIGGFFEHGCGRLFKKKEVLVSQKDQHHRRRSTTVY